jgi:hypothetical protein
MGAASGTASSAAMQPMPGAGHGLTIDVVGQVARREDAGDRGPGAARLDLHIAAVMQLQLVLDQFGRRRMADGDEDPSQGSV